MSIVFWAFQPINYMEWNKVFNFVDQFKIMDLCFFEVYWLNSFQLIREFIIDCLGLAKDLICPISCGSYCWNLDILRCSDVLRVHISLFIVILMFEWIYVHSVYAVDVCAMSINIHKFTSIVPYICVRFQHGFIRKPQIIWKFCENDLRPRKFKVDKVLGQFRGITF